MKEGPGDSGSLFLFFALSLIATVSRRPFPRAPVRRVRLGNGGGAFAPWKTARGGRKAPNTVSHSAKAPHASLGGLRPSPSEHAPGTTPSFPAHLFGCCSSPNSRLPVSYRASRSALFSFRPSASARPAPWETVLGLPKKARAVFHGAIGRAALPPSATLPPVRRDDLARLDAHSFS